MAALKETCMLLMHDGNTETQITATQFAEIFGVEKQIFNKLEKNPVFEINPRLTKPDKLNGGVTAPAGKYSRPIIQYKIKGKTYKFRLATTVIPDDVNPRKSTYEPKRVAFMDQLDIFPQLEQALFMYVLPACGDSPIKDKNWHYRFQNKEKKALEVTDKAANIGKALMMINTSLSDQDVILIAKGIYAQNNGTKAVIPNPSAKHKTLAEIKADLTQLALNDPDFFLANADNDINQFYGMMFDGVDRGIFEVKTGAHNIRSWYWNYGPKKGDVIAEIKPGQKDFDVLRGTIEGNPNAYYDTLMKSIQQATGKDNLAQFLAAKKAQDEENPDAPNIQLNKVPVTAPSPIPPLAAQATGADDTGTAEGDIHENPAEDLYDFPPELNLGNKAPADEPKVFTLPKTFEESNQLLASFNGGKKCFGNKNGAFWAKVKAGEVNGDNVAIVAGEIMAMADKANTTNTK